MATKTIAVYYYGISNFIYLNVGKCSFQCKLPMEHFFILAVFEIVIH